MSGAVILQEAEYSVELVVIQFFTLRPPKWEQICLNINNGG